MDAGNFQYFGEILNRNRAVYEKLAIPSANASGRHSACALYGRGYQGWTIGQRVNEAQTFHQLRFDRIRFFKLRAMTFLGILGISITFG